MIFNKHSELEGRHAILSPSKHYWMNYDDEALIRSYISSYATEVGTLVHEYAADRIKYKIPIDPESGEAKNGLLIHLMKNGIPFKCIDLDRLFNNLVPYVNDCIGYRMDSEIVLKYSDLCFGTADAIGVRRNWLRIHDLKTGITPASMNQLLCYAGLFFLEYKRDYRPQTMKVELRIYQDGDIQIKQPSFEEVKATMDKIIHGNNVLMKNVLEVA